MLFIFIKNVSRPLVKFRINEFMRDIAELYSEYSEFVI